MINHIFFIWSETVTRKTTREYETNADQLTNFGVGGVSSTCPTTKVILPHVWGKMANTGCLIVKVISHYPCVCRSIIITLNDSTLYACLSCDGFKICQLITNDLIQLLMLNLDNLPHVPLPDCRA